MAKTIGSITNFSGKIDDIKKGSINNSCAFASAMNMSQKEMTVNPTSEKDSGSTVVDLVLDSERISSVNYFYGNAGNFYKENSGTWSLEHTAADSQGNGMAFFGEDDNLYYGQNTTIGRFGPISGTANWNDDFLGQAGGEPTNTNSVDFESGSSQHAFRADTASLSLVSDMSLETYIKPESLPTTGNTMTLISKWDENTNLRSYKLDITTVSNFFGDGSDGALTIATNTTEAPIDANCTGTIDTNTLTVSNVTGSFVAGQKIAIHQTRGTNSGTIQYTSIESVSGATLTLNDLLTFSPVHSATASDANKAQVRVMKQHTTVTVNTGITYTAKAWDGLKGGILGYYANDTVSIVGTQTASEKGFRGGAGGSTGPATYD